MKTWYFPEWKQPHACGFLGAWCGWCKICTDHYLSSSLV